MGNRLDYILKNPEFQWLDNDTFIMTFGYSRDDDGWYNYMVEYWLDDNSYHFLKVYEYDTIEADFTDEEKEQLKSIIQNKINKEVKEEAKFKDKVKARKKLDYKLDGFKGVNIIVVDKKNNINAEEYLEFDSMKFGIDKYEFEVDMKDGIKDILSNLYEYTDAYYDDVYTEDEIDEIAEDITQDVLQLYDDLPEDKIDRKNGYADLSESKEDIEAFDLPRYTVYDYAESNTYQDEIEQGGEPSQFTIYDNLRDDFYYDELRHNPVFDTKKDAEEYIKKNLTENYATTDTSEYDTIGEIKDDGTVIKEYYRQGLIYKNFKNFEQKSGPCYIAEYQGEQVDSMFHNTISTDELNTKNFNDMVEGEDYETYNTIIETVKSALDYNDVEVTEEELEQFARYVFYEVDWQGVFTLANELLENGTYFTESKKLEEAKFKDKVKAIKKSLKKNDKRLSDETAQKSAERIAGSMIKNESMKDYGLIPSEDFLKSIYAKLTTALEIEDGTIDVDNGWIEFVYNGNTYYAEPASTFQIDVFDENHNKIAYGIDPKEIKLELFTEYNEGDFVYQLVGGDKSGEYTKQELDDLDIISGYTGENPGRRKELKNQPTLNGYLGPMFNGFSDEGKPVIRYETQEVYDMLSESKKLQEDEVIDRPEDIAEDQNKEVEAEKDIEETTENKTILDLLEERIGQELEAGRLNAVLQSIFGMYQHIFIMPEDLYNMDLDYTQTLTVNLDGEEYNIYYDIIDVDSGIVKIVEVEEI